MANDFCAAVILSLLGSLAVLQLLLAFGKPYGQYTWGGANIVLPPRLRIASVLSILLYVFFAVIIADAAGWITSSLPKSFVFTLAIYFTVGVVINGISHSKNERFIITPVVLILATCSWVIVLSS